MLYNRKKNFILFFALLTSVLLLNTANNSAFAQVTLIVIFLLLGNQEFLHKACQHSQLKSQSHEQNFVFRKSVCRQFAVIVAKLF